MMYILNQIEELTVKDLNFCMREKNFFRFFRTKTC